MKKFLLTAGDDYYPSQGDMDWIGCFATYEEAEIIGKFLKSHGGKNWYEVVDLDYWMSKDNEDIKLLNNQI